MTLTSLRNSLSSSRRVNRYLGTILVSVLAITAFSSWAFSSAFGSAPDDDYHLSSVWCSSFSGDTCEVDPGGEGVYIPEALREAIYCYKQNPTQSAGCQPFLDGTDPRPDVAFGHNNPVRNLYPDGYYMFQNLFKSESIQATALLIRFVNLSLFLGSAIGVFFALPLRLRPTWIWMWAIGLVPMGMFIVPSSNPSSWAITAVAAGWISLLGYLETKGVRAGVLGTIYLLSFVLAINARIDSVLYLGFASLVAVWISDLRGKKLVAKIWPSFIVGALIILQLAINPANLSRVTEGLGQRSDLYQDPIPWMRSTEVIDGSAFDWSLLWNNFLSIPGLWLGVFGGYPWGSLGWLDTTIPQIVLMGTMTVLVGIIFLSLKNAEPKKVISVMSVVVALWGMPLYLLQLGGFRTGEEVQARYLVPLIMVFLGTVLLTKSGIPVINERGRVWFVIIAISLANSIALHTNIRRYTTGDRVKGFNLNSPREWWWPFFPEAISPMTVWAIGSLAFVGLLWMLLRLVVPALVREIEPDANSVQQSTKLVG